MSAKNGFGKNTSLIKGRGSANIYISDLSSGDSISIAVTYAPIATNPLGSNENCPVTPFIKL